MPSTDQKITVAENPDLKPLGPDQPDDTKTAWQDLWIATETARTETPYGDEVRRQAGHPISQAISADPAEAARLRRARASARAGRTFPRHSDSR